MIVEHMIKAIAEILGDGEKVYVGLNSILPALGSFLARDVYHKNIRIYGVAEADNPLDITISPSTGDPMLAQYTPVFTTVDLFDLVQKGKLDVMFLGPIQIDEEININVSVIGSYEKPKVRLPGGAATAFMMPLIRKLILWNFRHNRQSFPKRVDFVTGTAKHSKNEVYVVTNLGVLHFNREKNRWEVIVLYPWSNINEIKSNTGFDVYEGDIKEIRVTDKDIEYIRKLDPYNLREGLIK
ncbi:CoA transferase [Sulfolobus acidocaldarius SUSAZ]|nr:CoA transferase [Sulfolobus acidocaldarius SUSAZ]